MANPHEKGQGVTREDDVKKLLIKGQRGFTLIELVVVIAILGVLAAVAVPLATNFLSDAAAESHDADKGRIQTAVDGYYGASGNTRFQGQRQYPVIGRGQTGSGLTESSSTVTLVDDGNPFTDNGGGSDDELRNVVGGAEGADLTATSVWVDGDGDGARTKSDGSSDQWSSVSKTNRSGSTVHTDPRYFFIDFEELVSAGWLDEIPESAAADNAPESSTGTYTGNYIWYVDENGRVESLLADFPDNTGFQDGVYP